MHSWGSVLDWSHWRESALSAAHRLSRLSKWLLPLLVLRTDLGSIPTNKKLQDVFLKFGFKLEPMAGIEPATAPLPWACSTTEPHRQKLWKTASLFVFKKFSWSLTFIVNSLRKFFASSIYLFLSVFAIVFLDKLTEYKVFPKNSSWS